MSFSNSLNTNHPLVSDISVTLVPSGAGTTMFDAVGQAGVTLADAGGLTRTIVDNGDDSVSPSGVSTGDTNMSTQDKGMVYSLTNLDVANKDIVYFGKFYRANNNGNYRYVFFDLLKDGSSLYTQVASRRNLPTQVWVQNTTVQIDGANEKNFSALFPRNETHEILVHYSCKSGVYSIFDGSTGTLLVRETIGVPTVTTGYNIDIGIGSPEDKFFGGYLIYTDTALTNDQVASLARKPYQVFVQPNVIPVADAGGDQNVGLNDTVQLDASNSYDENLDTLTYTWSLVSIPGGSTAVLSATDTVNPTFVADIAGDYIVSLVVNDGTSNSLIDVVTINADLLANQSTLNMSLTDIPDGNHLTMLVNRTQNTFQNIYVSWSSGTASTAVNASVGDTYDYYVANINNDGNAGLAFSATTV
jgi:hypothetical protein